MSAENGPAELTGLNGATHQEHEMTAASVPDPAPVTLPCGHVCARCENERYDREHGLVEPAEPAPAAPRPSGTWIV